MPSEKQPIEKMSAHDLMREWSNELGALGKMEQDNPTWEWKPVQLHLENLHALAKELRRKKALDRAKWQP